MQILRVLGVCRWDTTDLLTQISLNLEWRLLTLAMKSISFNVKEYYSFEETHDSRFLGMDTALIPTVGRAGDMMISL